jgi:hypothetical protein
LFEELSDYHLLKACRAPGCSVAESVSLVFLESGPKLKPGWFWKMLNTLLNCGMGSLFKDLTKWNISVSVVTGYEQDDRSSIPDGCFNGQADSEVPQPPIR